MSETPNIELLAFVDSNAAKDLFRARIIVKYPANIREDLEAIGEWESEQSATQRKDELLTRIKESLCKTGLVTKIAHTEHDLTIKLPNQGASQ